MTFKRAITILFSTVFLFISVPALADAGQWITADAGGGAFFVRSGATQINNDWSYVMDAGIQVGLPHGLEFAAPLALTFAPLRQRRFEAAVTVGITDFFPHGSQNFLYTPAVVLFTRIHMSHEAAALVAADYTHTQENFRRSPGFLRGAAALMVDMGPYLTWCLGISYQKAVVDRPLPAALPRSGFASRQRVSIGSVRATPYSDIPLFAVHLGTHFDLTVNGRIDIDSSTTNTVLEGGFILIW